MMKNTLIRDTAIRLGCLIVPLMLTACQQESTRNAPVTTTSAAGQSTAPTAAAAEARDTALIRVVHAIPAGSTVDVFAEDNRVFDNLAFKTITPYRELDGKRTTFRLRPAGMNQADALATNTEGLDGGEHYTMFAVPGDGDAAFLRVVKDNHSLPGTGKARVRVVHASGDAGEVDVYVVGRTDKLFEGVDFQSVTDYQEIDPVSGSLEVRPEGEANAMLTVPNVRLEAGKTYTVVVIGRVKTAPKLEALVIADQAMAATPR
ncbi:MAG TPA: DUF4397 domain-containing protein [Vicinamibacterales bacterium]|nr:DUF4397 domain-containing protein [Vicinamibacterales bacterium]